MSEPSDKIESGNKKTYGYAHVDENLKERLRRLSTENKNSTELNKKNTYDSKEKADEILDAFFDVDLGYHQLNTSFTRKSSQALYSGYLISPSVMPFFA